MTLTEFQKSLQSLKESLESDDSKLIDLFLNRLKKWPKDESNLKKLLQDLDRILGNVWFSTEKKHNKVYNLIEKFRKQLIL